MENQNSQEKQNEIKAGDLLSFPYASKFLQGICLDPKIEDNCILVESKREGILKVPSNKDVYKFFPGQKFDLREFYTPDLNSTEKLSIAERINAFLSRTNIGSFDNLKKNHKSDLLQLLKGKLTHNLFKGQSLIKIEGSSERELKNWEAKFSVYRDTDGSLKMSVNFKKEIQDLNVFNVEVNDQEKDKLLNKNEAVAITRTIKDKATDKEKEIKVFARYDKDLNSLVIFPYSEVVETKMKAAYEKRAAESQKQNTTNTAATPTGEAKNVFKEKNDKNSNKVGLHPKQDIKGNKGKKVS